LSIQRVRQKRDVNECPKIGAWLGAMMLDCACHDANEWKIVGPGPKMIFLAVSLLSSCLLRSLRFLFESFVSMIGFHVVVSVLGILESHWRGQHYLVHDSDENSSRGAAVDNWVLADIPLL